MVDEPQAGRMPEKEAQDDHDGAYQDLPTDAPDTDPVLQAELDTLESLLRAPLPEPEAKYLQESGCERVVALIEAIGQNPSVVGSADELDGNGNDCAAAAEDDLPEVRQLGQYRLLAKLGEGGMGAVYKALHTHLQKVVALKVLPADKLKDEDAVARFRREMRAVGQLNHPNIIAAHDAGEIDGHHYLVMELVDGIDVSSLVGQLGPLPVVEACEIVRQAAVGLQHAHEHGMVHRDIKPSNLMLATQGRVKILDMGLALLDDLRQPGARDLTGTGQMMGTVNYMAPEQCGDSHKVDIRADVYSLGATLYKLLTGRAPFADEKYEAVLNKLRALATEEAPPLHETREDVPRELSDFVARLLAKSPDERPTIPREVAEALAPFAEEARPGELLQFVEQLNDTDTDRTTDTFAHLSSSFTDTHRAATPKITRRPAAATSKPAARRWISIVAGFAIILVVAGLLWSWLSGILFTIETRQGIVTIEVPDGEEKNIEVAVLKGGNLVNILDAVNGWTVHLEDGRYQLDVHKGGDRFQLDKRNLTVTSNDKTRVKVTFRSTHGTRPPPPAKSPFDAATAELIQQAWAEYLGLPVNQVFELPGGEKLAMKLIPPGEFMMGSTEAERQWMLEGADVESNQPGVQNVLSEGPQHQVRVTRPFYLGTYEVTQAQWEAVMGNNPSYTKDTASHPVEQVSWSDIQQFLNKVNESDKQQGMKLVLPTEAQWEYACRAGTTTFWHCGDSDTLLQEYAWFAANSGEKTHPVGQLRPNGFGLYDMHGNVREWCADWFSPEYYKHSPPDDPKGPPTGTRRAHRGGGWHRRVTHCRSVSRDSGPPGNCHNIVGFRLGGEITDAQKPLAKF